MYFRDWLIATHANEQTPIGDVARDVRDDDDYPDGHQSETLREQFEYLDTQNANEDVLHLIEQAWGQFKGWSK